MANIISKKYHPSELPNFEKESRKVYTNLKEQGLQTVDQMNPFGIPELFPEAKNQVGIDRISDASVSEQPCGHTWIGMKIENFSNRCVYICKYGHRSYKTI